MLRQLATLSCKLWLVLIVVSASADGAWAESLYSIADLGTLSGFTASYAYGINDAGQVVGYVQTSSGASQAFLYSSNSMTGLGTLPNNGPSSYAYGINNSGQIVGSSGANYAVQPQQAFLYANGSMTPLPLPPGTLTGTSSVATGINSSGQAVGYLAFKTGVTDAFLYAGGIMKDLGTLGGTAAVANGINNSGQIAGTYSGQANQAFLDTNGSVSSLGGSNSSATGINNRGEVVGYYTTSSDYFHAFLYDGTKTSDLGTLGGTDSNYFADGINDSGQVVGYSTIGSTSEAFLYTDDTMMNLNSLIPTGLGWNLEVAAAINKNGQIVGWGFNANGQEHGFLLTPSASVVPEPSALVSLLGLGIAGMIGLWRRKRRAA